MAALVAIVQRNRANEEAEAADAQARLANDAAETADRLAREIAASEGRTFIHPFDDPEVIAAAKASGIPDSKIAAAQQSPVYQFVKKWKLALPLHPAAQRFYRQREGDAGAAAEPPESPNAGAIPGP